MPRGPWGPLGPGPPLSLLIVRSMVFLSFFDFLIVFDVFRGLQGRFLELRGSRAGRASANFFAVRSSRLRKRELLRASQFEGANRELRQTKLNEKREARSAKKFAHLVPP